MVKTDTSITVNKITLKWVNSIRAWYEHVWGRRITLDETIMQVFSSMDWMIAKETGRISKKTDFLNYARDRAEELAVDLSKEDLQDIVNVIKSWEEPDPKMWEYMKK